ALSSKRQLRNRFLRNYGYRVEVYDHTRHLAACRSLLDLWRGQQQDARDGGEGSDWAGKRRKETRACELALEQGHVLGLKGIVVYVEKSLDSAGESTGPGGGDSAPSSVRGFTFGEFLGHDQSSIVIEKTDLTVKGLAQFIFSE